MSNYSISELAEKRVIWLSRAVPVAEKIAASAGAFRASSERHRCLAVSGHHFSWCQMPASSCCAIDIRYQSASQARTVS
jgi:hypothetical protein